MDLDRRAGWRATRVPYGLVARAPPISGPPARSVQQRGRVLLLGRRRVQRVHAGRVRLRLRRRLRARARQVRVRVRVRLVGLERAELVAGQVLLLLLAHELLGRRLHHRLLLARVGRQAGRHHAGHAGRLLVLLLVRLVLLLVLLVRLAHRLVVARRQVARELVLRLLDVVLGR